ncbi:MAG: hypothetical protein JO082_05780 [Mycobacterium sp.]|nr:hypothetical protein [Mycobacterium sp.]
MSGQGQPIFVDELQRFVADVADSRCAVIADRLIAPLRVGVSGRRGVGSSTVAHALARAGSVAETITVTSAAEADIDVYVLAEVVKPEDRAAIAAAGRPMVAVLNKADLIATAESGRYPHERASAARRRCARLAEVSGLTGVPIEPVVGVLAVAALDDLVDDALWVALQQLATRPADLSSPDNFLAGPYPLPVQLRRRLLRTLDVFGVQAAAAAIRRGATRTQTRTLLRRLSCIDDVVDEIATVAAPVHYHRVLDAVADLEMLAVTDCRVGEFLSRDETVIARMTAAVNVVEAVGMRVDRCDSAPAHLRRAVGWQRYSRGPVSGMHRACGADIVRGSLRLWSKARNPA